MEGFEPEQLGEIWSTREVTTLNSVGKSIDALLQHLDPPLSRG